MNIKKEKIIYLLKEIIFLVIFLIFNLTLSFADVYIYKDSKGKIYLTNNLKTKLTYRYKDNYTKYKRIIKSSEVEEEIVVEESEKTKSNKDEKPINLDEETEESEVKTKEKPISEETEENEETEKSNEEATPSEENNYDEIIMRYSKIFMVEFELIKSVIKAESNFNEKAVSPKGAKGLMQLLDSTFNSMLKTANFKEKNIFSPEQNIYAGTKYLAYLINKFPTLELALAAYNAGEAIVSDIGDIPDYEETKNYVTKVLENFNKYKELNKEESKIIIRKINNKIFLYNQRYSSKITEE
ncbi:MAG TPA: lytic transglycosylase domain-containing protein [bacterium]|nr:lytic transglycosylase domain-containing protein [bacterium]HOL46997.1 lytic transglycosylase domain-containing protein [bacterium]HPQ19007.1 lytic transglycosylase domain-containing protein [bacterium]